MSTGCSFRVRSRKEDVVRGWLTLLEQTCLISYHLGGSKSPSLWPQARNSAKNSKMEEESEMTPERKYWERNNFVIRQSTHIRYPCNWFSESSWPRKDISSLVSGSFPAFQLDASSSRWPRRQRSLMDSAVTCFQELEVALPALYHPESAQSKRWAIFGSIRLYKQLSSAKPIHSLQAWVARTTLRQYGRNVPHLPMLPSIHKR